MQNKLGIRPQANANSFFSVQGPQSRPRITAIEAQTRVGRWPKQKRGFWDEIYGQLRKTGLA